MRCQRIVKTACQFAGASVVGLIIWALIAVSLYYALDALFSSWDEQESDIVALYAGVFIGFVVGVPLGAALGAAIVSKFMKEQYSFRKALYRAIAGMIVGGFLGVCLILLSNAFGMDWWNQDIEMKVWPVIPFLLTALAATEAPARDVAS